ncbi:hypothetical protein JRQ81_012323 [Phrynocephalus forsythii]|uniref:Uncharacterized protein n=1 Tax=Phrynocephalus forsythii TaxID=171643 RepID=A0A9Q1AQD5_9SAUR|nr:hypothetical protein JRQ81_012323 [Phrynocephalus forsythii]
MGPIAEQPWHGPEELPEVEQSQKWQKYTLPENRAIMKCSYRAELEKRGYQKWMHQLWKPEYPNSKITELRLAGQRRYIIRNKVFSKVKLEEIQRGFEIGGQQIIQIRGENRLITPGDIEQSEVEENLDVVQTFEPQEGSIRIGTPADLTIRQQELKNKILTLAALNEERGRLPILKTVPRKKWYYS